MNEPEFRIKADQALEQLERALLPLADEHGVELDMQNGVLQVVFEEPAPTKFVVSQNGPVRQIWVSAIARSYKLPWAEDLNAFALEGESLDALLVRLVKQYLSTNPETRVT